MLSRRVLMVWQPCPSVSFTCVKARPCETAPRSHGLVPGPQGLYRWRPGWEQALHLLNICRGLRESIWPCLETLLMSRLFYFEFSSWHLIFRNVGLLLKCMPGFGTQTGEKCHTERARQHSRSGSLAVRPGCVLTCSLWRRESAGLADLYSSKRWGCLMRLTHFWCPMIFTTVPLLQTDHTFMFKFKRQAGTLRIVVTWRKAPQNDLKSPRIVHSPTPVTLLHVHFLRLLQDRRRSQNLVQTLVFWKNTHWRTPRGQRNHHPVLLPCLPSPPSPHSGILAVTFAWWFSPSC